MRYWNFKKLSISSKLTWINFWWLNFLKNSFEKSILSKQNEKKFQKKFSKKFFGKKHFEKKIKKFWKKIPKKSFFRKKILKKIFGKKILKTFSFRKLFWLLNLSWKHLKNRKISRYFSTRCAPKKGPSHWLRLNNAPTIDLTVSLNVPPHIWPRLSSRVSIQMRK